MVAARQQSPLLAPWSADCETRVRLLTLGTLANKTMALLMRVAPTAMLSNDKEERWLLAQAAPPQVYSSQCMGPAGKLRHQKTSPIRL